MKHLIILENIRSAYNVGNVLRTADGLGFDVAISGYTAHPNDEPKILKTSLGSENHVNLQQFRNPGEVLNWAKAQGYYLIAAEIGEHALPLPEFGERYRSEFSSRPLAIIFGNERRGVLPETLEHVDEIIFIPMQGIKESFNVGQSTAIFMWELRKR